MQERKASMRRQCGGPLRRQNGGPLYSHLWNNMHDVYTNTIIITDISKYAEICKAIKKKAREDIRKYSNEIIRESIMGSKSLNTVRRTEMLGEDRLITLFDKQGR